MSKELSQHTTPEIIKHVGDNIDVINAYIATNADLQPSNPILLPLKEAFQLEHPNINLGGTCRECFIDMLRWYKAEWKKTQPTEESEPTKKSKN